METLNNVINSLKIIGISIAGIAFVVLMIKIAVEPEMKGRYLKLTKHLLLATILITVSLTLVDIPKSYYGDKIAIDMIACKIELLVSDSELERRKANWKKPEPKIKTGYLARYAKLVTNAATGAVFKDE